MISKGRAKRLTLSCIGICICVAASTAPASGQTAKKPPKSTYTILPTPEWLAWKGFYQSIIVSRRQSDAPTRRAIVNQFGLSFSQVDALMTLAGEYVSEVEKIDADARAV